MHLSQCSDKLMFGWGGSPSRSTATITDILREWRILLSALVFAQELGKNTHRRGFRYGGPPPPRPNQPENDVLFPACSGFLQTRKQVYLIKPLGGSDDGEHAIFRREQLKVNGTPSCGSITSYDGDRGPKLASLFSSRAWVGVWSL